MHTTSSEVKEKDPPSLKAAQEAVGGYVEIVRIKEGQLLVNEEGLILGYPENPNASKAAGQPIYGNAILLKGSAKWD